MGHRIRAFFLLATIVIVGHAGVFIWHLFIAANIPPGLPPARILSIAIAINAATVVGLILLLLQIYRPATLLILPPMFIMFVIGAYEHFASLGPSSVFAVSDADWARSFATTAILLIVLELLGCWIGARSWFLHTREQTRTVRSAS